jgi:MYXO-CTERM domain-containing protein
VFSCGATDGGSEGKAGALDNGPTVVASGRVGFLDWVELKAETVASFTDWLTANGYPYADTATLAFSYYVQQGWHFLAFRISQDVVPGSGTVCKALGPISLSFPSATPVVPVRMGSVGAMVSGSSSFTWRIFGITRGAVQLSAQAGSLQYSGAIKDSDVSAFAGLAEVGDRLTRLYLTFYAGTTGISDTMGTVGANDYRAIEYVPDDSSCSVGVTSSGHPNASLALVGLALLGLILWRRRR